MEIQDTADQHTSAESDTAGSGSPWRWWGLVIAAVLVAGAFVGGFFVGKAAESEHTTDATSAACRSWQVNGTAADALAARVRAAVEESGFNGNPGRRFRSVVAAARTAAMTPELDDQTFAEFTDLARRADAAQRSITPNGVALLDRDTLSAYRDALAAIAVTCHAG